MHVARCLLLAVLCLPLTAFSGVAQAGGGPERVLLVINPRSASSLAIANYYAALRGIPACNLSYVPWDPKAETTDVDTFRRQILNPVINTIRPRTGQIDYIVYSSDFPWGIDLESDFQAFKANLQKGSAGEEGAVGASTWPTHNTPRGSINGLTYLWEPMSIHNSGYLDLHSNWYCQTGNESRAFASSANYGPRGGVIAKGGRGYLLSTMLGVTSGRGNSYDEVIRYLGRSATADGTHPPGTVYFVQNGNVRSKVRQGEFPSTVRQLISMNVAAEILEGEMPMGKNDIIGTMMGVANFDWKSSKSTILPGAICEHFTSFGGAMNTGAAQTPLSEFLRYGAAGASGTVTEPYAVPPKFPASTMHVHYARGCTLAESFYQAVASPYQLLIVGDPLCRPWANIPKVSVSGVEPGATIKGVLRLQPSAEVREGTNKVSHFELFVDGLRVAVCKPQSPLEVDTARLADGYHELRVVAIEAGAIQSQGRQLVPIMTANHQRAMEVTASASETLDAQDTLVITVKAPGCQEIGVLQGTRLLGKVDAEEGRVEIKGSTLGIGPVRLQVFGLGAEGPPSNVLSKPLDLVVKTNPKK